MTSHTSAAFIDFVRAAVTTFYGFNKRQIMTVKSNNHPVKHTHVHPNHKHTYPHPHTVSTDPHILYLYNIRMGVSVCVFVCVY